MSDLLPIETAPKDGTRIYVFHTCVPTRERGSVFGWATGMWDGSSWACSEVFISPTGQMFWQPTHWLPKDEA